jgi:hypothetical protein
MKIRFFQNFFLKKTFLENVILFIFKKSFEKKDLLDSF